MAMDKKSIITIAVAGGAAYLAYWWATNYGPAGDVATHGGPSYWDTWFGHAPAPVVGASQPAPGQTVPTNTNQPGYVPPATTPVATVPPASIVSPAITIKGKIQASSQGNGLIVNGQANADVWNWFYVQFAPAPLTSDQFQAAFLANGENRETNVMTLDQFLSRIQAAGVGVSGIGQIVEAPSVQSLPLSSSSFGRRNPNGLDSRQPRGYVN